AGIQLEIGNDVLTAPAQATAIENSRLSLSVISPQVVDGIEYEFAGWSNAGDQTQLYTVSGDATLTVFFTEVGSVVDTDNDGLPDDWELQFGLDPLDPGDAALDGDEDRLSNFQEFGSGTDPGDADSDDDGWDDFTELHFAGDPLDPDVEPDPPIISIDAPESGAVIDADQIQVEFSTSGMTLMHDHVHLTLDAMPHVTMNGLSGSHVFSGVAPGSHTLTAHIAGDGHLPYTHPGAMQRVTVEVVVGPECGNGVVEEGEACDDAGASATCDADCTPAECGDGVVNNAAGEACDTSGQSANCDADCTLAECGDGVLNAAAGEECDDANSIDDDFCSNTCVSASCTDQRKNGSESDVDCGGSCPNGCALGQGCQGHADCTSNVCDAGTCSQPLPACDDGLHNGDETDVDCGGSCGACPDGAGCLGGGDCVSGVCAG